MATYYIDTTGVDDAGRNGLTTGTAWATLSYACTRVTTAGDTIFVNAGTYTETAQSALAVGVNIMGAGVTSIITVNTDALDPIILLSSATQGTSGNQSISYLKFDGNDTTAYVGIQVIARGNISIHHCEFVDFFWAGIRMSGKTTYTQGEPDNYALSNRIYNCNFTNCGREDQVQTMWMSSGAIIANGQEDLRIYNNYIDNVTGGRQGYGLKLVGIQWTGAEANWGEDGFFKGLKIHNNVIKVNHTTGKDQQWAFSMEIWSSRGGLEIYDNDLQGTIDIAGYESNDQYGYGYASKVYRNTISWDAVSVYEDVGIVLEPSTNGGTYIYQNNFKNLYYGIRLFAAASDITPGFSDVFIYYNIFEDIRISTAGWYGYVLTFSSSSYGPGIPFTNIYFENNVVRNSVSGSLLAALRTGSADDIFTNINVRNNIIVGAARIFEFNVAGTYTGFHIDNNIFYGTAFADQWGSAVDSTYDNNLTSDPLFVGGSPYSYALQPNSPAIDAGLDVGLISDFIGTLVPYGSAPDIGAYEWFEVEYDFSNITLVNTPACYNAVDNTIISRWVATECPINFTLLRRDWYITNSSDVGGFLAISVYGTFSGNDGDVISVYDLTTNSMYTGTITDSSGDPVLITDIPYVSGMDIKYLNDHTLYAGYYFEGRLTINGVVESLTVIASPDSFGYADLDVSGILRIKTSIGKVTNYLSLIQKDTNKSGQFTLEYRGCWYGSNEAWISEGSTTSPASEVIWYYAECVRSEEQGCNLAEYVPTDLNDAPFLNQFDTPVYWYGLPFDLSFILPERAELSPTSDIIVTMKVYNSANVQMGADISQTISVDSLEGYVNSLNIDSTLIDAGAAYFTVEITAM